MNYKDLQNKAKELGLPYVGVSRVELEKTIAEKTNGEPPVPPEPQEQKTPVVEKPVIVESKKEKGKRGRKSKENKEESPELKNKPTEPTPPEPPKEIEVPKDANTATIFDGSFKVRVYTLENHGEDFSELAKSFIKGNPKFRVEFTKQLPVLRCPNCGAKVKCGTCGKDIS